MATYEVRPIGILLALIIGFIPGLLFFGYIGGALIGIIALSTYILTVQSLDSGSVLD